ncbi:MAG: hypothetical protein ACR2FY_05260 [Pirellulaceae bacterium]
MSEMQQTVLFDIADASFRWWYCWPAAILLLSLIFPLWAYLGLEDSLTRKQRRNATFAWGGIGAAIILLWLLFVGPPTLGEYLRFRRLRIDRGSDRLVEIEGVFVGGNSAHSELGGGGGLTTFDVRDNQGVRHKFTTRLTESIRFSDLQPFVKPGARLRVSYVPRSSGDSNDALRVVLVPKSAK